MTEDHALGLRCYRCKEVKPVDSFWRNASSKTGRQGFCKPCCAIVQRKSLVKNRPRRRAWETEYRKRFPERLKRHRDDYRDKLKSDVYNSYGGFVCACCGVKDVVFLTIDHINGGGNKHLREIGGGRAFYKWLRKNRFPPGFQVLCRNCNWAKSHGGCPHANVLVTT